VKVAVLATQIPSEDEGKAIDPATTTLAGPRVLDSYDLEVLRQLAVVHTDVIRVSMELETVRRAEERAC
jgi:hypothetical protein